MGWVLSAVLRLNATALRVVQAAGSCWTPLIQGMCSRQSLRLLAAWRSVAGAQVSSRGLTIVMAGATALALSGCYNGADRSKAHLRLVNATSANGGYNTLDLRLQELLTHSTAGYGTATEYSDTDPNATAATLASAGAATTLSSFTTSLTRDKYFTVLAYGSAGNLKQVLLDDNLSAPAEGKSQVRVVHGAPGAGALDVYVTANNDSLASATPVQAGSTFGGSVAAPVTVNSGTWQLRVTAAGSKTDVRLDLPALILPNRQVVTLVITPTLGGTLVNGLLLVQQGALSRHDTTQARVRAVAGVAPIAAVAVMLGDATLLTGTSTFPVTAGVYQVVPAGAVPPSITVGGTALVPPSTALAAGGDYTLLVYGPRAAASSSWITDDNRLPSNEAQSRLRLVNGAGALSGTAAMALDGAVLAFGVVSGTASPYTDVNARASAEISVVASASPLGLYGPVTRSLAAGATYSVFVLGAPGAVSGSVVADRER
jgi:hypothetical protein